MEAQKGGLLEEEVFDRGGDAFVCAPHGGGMEPYTEGQAKAVLQSTLSSGWIARGLSRENPFEDWHVTSNDISVEQFPLLSRFSEDMFEIGVSFHGMGPFKGILLGGGADVETKLALKRRFDEYFNSEWDTPSVMDDQPDTLTPEYLSRASNEVPSEYTPIFIATSPDDKFDGGNPESITNRFIRNHTGLQLEQSMYVRRFYGQEVADIVAEFIDEHIADNVSS